MTNRQKFLSFIGTFLLSYAASGQAWAATYYVATNGRDSNAGSEAAPFRTIEYAVKKMVAGDTTYVRGGIYNPKEIIRFKRSGTESAPIKLLNYPGETPTIDWVTQQLGQVILVQNVLGEEVAIGYITIEGFEIKNGHDGIKFYSMHNSVIRRNWIHDSINQGIMGVGGHHNLFDRNVFNHNGNFPACAGGKLTKIGTSVCNQSHGLYLHGQSYTITNNLIYDNQGYGIQQNGSPTSFYDPSKHPSPDFAGSDNWIVANNTFAYQHYRSGMVVWGSKCNNTRIENNIFYENSQKRSAEANGVGFTSTSCRGVQIRNNLAYAASPGGTAFLGAGATEGVHYTASDNIVNTSNPNFEGAGATISGVPNFKLRAGSPAIDKGVPVKDNEGKLIVTWDHAGGKRPFGSAFDIGAYEFGAPPDSGSPPPNPTGGGGIGGGGGPVLLGPNGEVCYSGYITPSLPQ